MRGLIILLAAELVCSCSPLRRLPAATETRSDSLRVEIGRRTVWVADTLRWHLPVERTERRMRTDSSRLETSAAISEVRIAPDGSLVHTLENKPDERSVATRRRIEYRDSIVYRDRTVGIERTVPVERELTWWQKVRLKGFWVVAAALAILLRSRAVSLLRHFV